MGRQVLLPGWGGAALAGDVCCHWSPGSGRLLPLGTSPTGGRERRGGPSWPPGPALQLPLLIKEILPKNDVNLKKAFWMASF